MAVSPKYLNYKKRSLSDLFVHVLIYYYATAGRIIKPAAFLMPFQLHFMINRITSVW